ncbi:MAG TPA: hypothetical protein VG270_04710 [Pseudolabrys sp.]|jgi:hypothetical protein|nr:hypothetical protein [Pseudolabrys sp.]
MAVDIRPADRAMSLMLADANPRFDLEISASGINSLKFSGPLASTGCIARASRSFRRDRL